MKKKPNSRRISIPDHIDIVLSLMLNYEGLPDLTPTLVDEAIKKFTSKLCCKVNSVAVISKKVICTDCFFKLKGEYTGGHWEL